MKLIGIPHQLLIIHKLIRVIMRLNLEIVIMLQKLEILLMERRQLIEWGGEAGADLNDIRGNAQELIEGQTVVIIHMIRLGGQADDAVQLMDAGGILGEENSMIIITNLGLKLLGEIDFHAMNELDPLLIAVHFLFHP